ncbi:hypothetical protein [Gordonia soli]|nr:hypothetical protein [Gordonia soli]
MMMKRAAAAGLIAAGVLTGGVVSLVEAGEADATVPRVGAHCDRAEVNSLRRTKGISVVCAHTGPRSGTRWVRTAPADPVVRYAGQSCSGRYAVAATRIGVALKCVDGRWRFGP